MSTKHIPGPWHLSGNRDSRLIDFAYEDADGNRHSGNIGVIAEGFGVRAQKAIAKAEGQ